MLPEAIKDEGSVLMRSVRGFFQRLSLVALVFGGLVAAPVVLAPSAMAATSGIEINQVVRRC